MTSAFQRRAEDVWYQARSEGRRLQLVRDMIEDMSKDPPTGEIAEQLDRSKELFGFITTELERMESSWWDVNRPDDESIGRKVFSTLTATTRNSKLETMEHLLKSCRASIDSLETNVLRLKRGKELDTALGNLSDSSRVHLDIIVREISEMRREITELPLILENRLREKDEGPKADQPRAPSESDSILKDLTLLAVNGLRLLGRTMACQEFYDLSDRISSWCFGLLDGPLSLDALPLRERANMAPYDHLPRDRTWPAWFLEIATELFLIAVETGLFRTPFCAMSRG